MFLVSQLYRLGSVIVPNIGIERGGQHERVMQILRTPLTIGGDTCDTIMIEGHDAVGQQPDRLQKIVDAHRHEHI